MRRSEGTSVRCGRDLSPPPGARSKMGGTDPGAHAPGYESFAPSGGSLVFYSPTPGLTPRAKYLSRLRRSIADIVGLNGVCLRRSIANIMCFDEMHLRRSRSSSHASQPTSSRARDGASHPVIPTERATQASGGIHGLGVGLLNFPQIPRLALLPRDDIQEGPSHRQEKSRGAAIDH